MNVQRTKIRIPMQERSVAWRDVQATISTRFSHESRTSRQLYPPMRALNDESLTESRAFGGRREWTDRITGSRNSTQKVMRICNKHPMAKVTDKSVSILVDCDDDCDESGDGRLAENDEQDDVDNCDGDSKEPGKRRKRLYILQLSHLILLLISNATAFMPRHKSRATEVETNVRSCVMSRQSAESTQNCHHLLPTVYTAFASMSIKQTLLRG